VPSNKAQQILLTIGITAASRVCVLRDRLLHRIPPEAFLAARPETGDPRVTRHSIACGDRRLDAVLVRPRNSPALASVLLCHGIGEQVEHWYRVQQILAGNGVASLVFDYSGYGRSQGWFSAGNAEQDSIAAFHLLERLTAPLPVSLLGLSLGSGISAAIVHRIPAHRLVLLGAFTSLRNAAVSIFLPRAFASAVLDTWNTRAALAQCIVPLLLVHGEKDQLFPPTMAEELAASCASPCKLVIVPGLGHNEPFYHPRQSYWGDTVAQFLVQSE
jgi:pimeloyl-ACP methyl ester carboxylesterase